MHPAAKRATYEDLLALPEGARAELMGGEIVTLPSPMPRHLRAQRALGRFIGGPFDDDDGFGGPGGCWTLEAYQLDGERWVDVGTYDERDVARIAPFEDVELPVARLSLPRELAPG